MKWSRILFTIALFVAEVSALPTQAFAIDKLCCPCKAPNGSRVIATTVPSLPNACSAACTSNGDKPTSEAPWQVDQSQQCSMYQKKASAPVVPPTDLIEDIRYSVGHQGASIWTGPGERILKGKALRESLSGVDMDKRHILAASPKELEEAAVQAMDRCVAQRNIDADFAWVCRVKGHDGELTILLSQGKFDNMRSVFSNTQAHDDQLRNLIYCRNNKQLADLVHNHCP